MQATTLATIKKAHATAEKNSNIPTMQRHPSWVARWLITVGIIQTKSGKTNDKQQ